MIDLEQAVNHSVNKMGLHNHEIDHWCFPARKISIKRGKCGRRFQNGVSIAKKVTQSRVRRILQK